MWSAGHDDGDDDQLLRVFSFEVPKSAKAGDVCKVNLPDGESVELTIPETAVPGATIEFAAPSDVLIEGRLSTKSPKKSLLRYSWQSRWFELHSGIDGTFLNYWDAKRTKQGGSLPLSQLVGIRSHHLDGRRLDLRLRSARLIELRAKTQADRDEWVKRLERASTTVVNHASATVPSHSAADDVEVANFALGDLGGSMRTEEEAAEEAEETPVEADEPEEEDVMAILSDALRAVSLPRAGSVPHGGVQADAPAQPPIQARYLSRVDRARSANSALARGAMDGRPETAKDDT